MLVRTLSGTQHRGLSRINSGESWESREKRRRHSSRRRSVTSSIRSYTASAVAQRSIAEEDEDEETEKEKQKTPKVVSIRVGGRLFQTRESTLDAYPFTMLGDKRERLKYYDSSCDEYVFKDRCHLSFDAILFYYQSRGILSRPAYVKRAKFMEELQFFRITDILDQRDEQERIFLAKERAKNAKPQTRRKERVWRLLCFKNNPRFRNRSYVVYVVVLFLSTLPITFEPTVPPKTLWLIMELIFAVIFAFEYLIRIYIANNKLQYLLSPMGVLDFVTMNASSVHVILFLVRPSCIDSTLKFFLVFRVLKYTRVSRGVQELVHVLWACREYITLFVGTALSCCLVTAAHLQDVETKRAEQQNTHNYVTYKHTSHNYVGFGNWFWYSIITVTGVGYGDYFPRSAAGRLFGGLLSVFGVLVFCMAATQLVYKFVDIYYLPDIVGTDSDTGMNRHRRMLITRIRDEFLDDMEVEQVASPLM